MRRLYKHKYCSSKLFADPWHWWLQIGRTRYLVIIKISRDYLSILSTSCDCERTSSRARWIITSDCNALSCNTIYAPQLQNDWLNRDVSQSELDNLHDFCTGLDPIVQKNCE